ncbi:MAG: hypothetical protein ACKPKO_39250, partial [Candidatus Fonsibacter sp.]
MLMSPHNVQAKAACTAACCYGIVEDQLQGMRPCNWTLGVLAVEVDAHADKASEPQAWLRKVHLRDVPRDIVGDIMGDGAHFAGLADNYAWARLQDKAVSVVSLNCA